MSRVLALVVSILVACDAGAKSPPPAPPPPVAAKPPPPPVKPGPPKMPIADHIFLASLHRDVCYGTCPAYTITVYRDGKVEFEGESFVKKKGKADGTLTGDQLNALEKMFIDGKFATFDGDYTHQDATDVSSATLSYQPFGAAKAKSVPHYHGDMKAPKELGEFESRFDEIVQIDHWIGTRAEREKTGY